MQSELSILFLDDHPGLRDGTALILSQKNPKLKFFCAGTTDEAVELLRSHTEISIALVDLNLEGENGLDSVKKLREIQNSLKIIIYTMYADSFHVNNSLKSSIQGYVTKNTSVTELLHAISAVENGGTYFCTAASRIVNFLLSPETAYDEEAELFANYKMLSKSEQQLFELLAKKIELKEISEIIGKKEKTVLNKRTIIYQKLGLSDRLDLIEAARKLGVIE